MPAHGHTQIWGEARTDDGQRVQLALRAGEAYSLTAKAAVLAAQKLLAGSVPTGAVTPALAFGARFVAELPGVEICE